MSEENPVTHLSEEECWDKLESQEFGRMAYHLVDEVSIVPINYAVDQRRLIFRTGEGSKLIGVVMNSDVAFEIDSFAEDEAWSVIVHGHARRLEEDEAHVVENLPLRTWVDTPKYDVVSIEADTVTGRSFELHRPWLRIRRD